MSTQILISGGSGGASGMHTPIKFNEYISSMCTSAAILTSSLTSFSMSSEGIYGYPYIPRYGYTATQLFVNVTAAVAGKLGRIVIYEDVNGKPINKIYESSNLDLSTTGVKTALTSFTFVSGTTYWLAFQANGVAGGSISGITSSNTMMFGGITTSLYNCLFQSVLFGTSAPSPYNPLQGLATTLPYIAIRMD